MKRKIRFLFRPIREEHQQQQTEEPGKVLRVAAMDSPYVVRFVNILALITGISTLICVMND